MNSWFENAFLHSLFKRCDPGECGPTHNLWLTRNQTEVCIKYMERHEHRYDSDGYGTMYEHLSYTCRWRGRDVRLEFSKLNGCGCISFGMTDEEQEIRRQEIAAENLRIRLARIERTKRKPERLAKRIEVLTTKLQDLMNQWEDEKQSDPLYDDADEKYYREAVDDIRWELGLLQG